MASQATSTAPRAAARVRAALSRMRASEALRTAWSAFLWSRLGIAAVAVVSARSLGSGGLPEANAARYDDPSLTKPLGGLGDLLLSPLAHWDAVWYLGIADAGYGAEGSPRTAFFPLYPLMARVLGELGGGGRGALLLGAYAVSLAALLLALYLLHRLTALELGPRVAGVSLVLICAFPASLYLGAPYSESLYLAASVGTFLAARTGHWAWAGVAAGAASATRSAGVLLLLPLVILYLWGPREDRQGEARRPRGRGGLGSLRPVHAMRRDAAWLALAPAGLIAYAGWLWATHGDPLAFAGAQDFWRREFAGPLGAVPDAAAAAWDGARQLLSGSREHVYFTAAGGDPFRVAAENLILLGFLGFAAVAAVGVLRRLPFAYGAYVVAALVLALSYPVPPQPLMSLPRFMVVLFPVFMWLALVCEERRCTVKVAGASAFVLGLFTTQFAGWYWVA